MFAATGWSADSHAFTAGQTAATVALKRLSGRQPRGAIVLGSSWFDQQPLLDGVRSVLGDVPLAGGSTAGEMTSEGPHTHSCAVLAFGHNELAVAVGVGPEVARDPRLAGFRAAQEATRQLNGQLRRGMLFFGDGLSTAYADVVRGMREILGTGSLTVGALMGDDLRFVKTYQYSRTGAVNDAVVALLLGGNVAIGVGMHHGFAPISKPWEITQANHHILYALDGRPAASVYDDYFEAELLGRARGTGTSRQVLGYPLGMKQHADGPFLLRNIMRFGHDGSLACTGEMTPGAVVHLMISSRAQALEAASRAARDAVRSLTSVSWVFVCDSVARKRLLGHEAGDAITRIREVVGASVPLIGCYTYGEHGSMLQTGSIVVMAVGQ